VTQPQQADRSAADHVRAVHRGLWWETKSSTRSCRLPRKGRRGPRQRVLGRELGGSTHRRRRSRSSSPSTDGSCSPAIAPAVVSAGARLRYCPDCRLTDHARQLPVAMSVAVARRPPLLSVSTLNGAGVGASSAGPQGLRVVASVVPSTHTVCHQSGELTSDRGVPKNVCRRRPPDSVLSGGCLLVSPLRTSCGLVAECQPWPLAVVVIAAPFSPAIPRRRRPWRLRSAMGSDVGTNRRDAATDCWTAV